MSDRVEAQVRAAMASADDEAATPIERAEMLMEIAMGLQQRPKTADQISAAIELYERAEALCPQNEALFKARILARKATAQQAIPEEGSASIELARETLLEALKTLRPQGLPEEVAEAEMNLGIVLQSLAGVHRARITDAIAAYQRALRTFDKARFPCEFAILQNNLATAFLAIPFTDERSKMREALAVQAFEEGLRTINLVDNPSEYAMLQNNLGNALQYASSSHVVENNVRALEAYDEALKVRTKEVAPVQYANTIANKANCLWNLPDDPSDPKSGSNHNLRLARGYYAEAREIFMAHGEFEKGRIVAEAKEQIERQILSDEHVNGAVNGAYSRS